MLTDLPYFVLRRDSELLIPSVENMVLGVVLFLRKTVQNMESFQCVQIERKRKMI